MVWYTGVFDLVEGVDCMVDLFFCCFLWQVTKTLVVLIVEVVDMVVMYADFIY